MKRSHKKQIRIPREEGSIDFTAGSLSTTDPSYDRDSFGKISNIEIIPGKYLCRSIIGKDGARIAEQIVLDDTDAIRTVDANHSWIQIGYITSESKTLGIFQNKPDFKAFKLIQVVKFDGDCKIWSDKTYKSEPKGFVFTLPNELAEYKVRVVKTKGRVVAIEISLV